MPRHATQEIRLAINDFRRGLLGGISERAISKVDWLAGADNLYGRPFRGMRIRPGSRDISSAILSEQPHSLMAYYSSGGNKVFVAAENVIREATTSDYPLQTLPASHPANSDIFTHTNLDGVLIATQRGGALTPLMYDGAWKELKLPTPTDAIGFAADSAPGSVDAGTHYFRVRHRYAKGSTLAGPVSAGRVVAGPNFTVNINAGLVPASPRSDYVGWTLEMTKVNGTALGPWWFVADGTASTYAVTKSDAQLGYMADEGLHGQPPHFDGVTGFAGLLWGWSGSSLYASRDIGDLEATGIANFDADDLFQIAKDDGDTIQVCLVVLDELLILKKRSVHVISGVDRDSFVLTSVVYADPARGSEAGCAGPRAACVIGGVAYFWGESGGLFTYSRGSVKPAGWTEVGRYLDDVNPGELDKLLLINHQGNYALGWYPPGSSALASEQVVNDVRFKQYWHWKGWTARDAIELKSGLFGGASMLFCDPSNRASFGTIAAGTSISGPGIQASSTIPGGVLAGATQLTMDKVAAVTANNVVLTIGGALIGRCNTTYNSPVVTITEYHVWAGFDGFRDEKPGPVADEFSAPGGVIPAQAAFAFTGRLTAQQAQVYAHGLLPTGADNWTPGSTLVSINGVLAATEPAIITDGFGGFIVVWNDARSGTGDIYAQRYDAVGVAQWAAGGVPANSSVLAQTVPVLVSDGDGGAIIAWLDNRSGTVDVYAQRINAQGAVQWAAAGVALSTVAGNDQRVSICSDENGGAVIAWSEAAGGFVRAQRLDALGVSQWTAGGVALSSTTIAGVSTVSILKDSGGAFVAWTSNFDTYVQRINSAGVLQWGATAVNLGIVSSVAAPSLATDGAGGVFVAHRASNIPTVRRILTGGTFAWAAVSLSGAGNLGNVTAVSDEALGAIIVWSETTPNRVRGQRVDSTGAAQWNTGSPVNFVTAANPVRECRAVSDAVGGAFFAWYQDVGSGVYDAYAQRVDPNGNLLSSTATLRASAITNATITAFMSIAVSLTSAGESLVSLPPRVAKDVHFAIETPWLDGGLPSDWKDMDRVEYSADGDATNVNVAIDTDPAGSSSSVALTSVGQGADWAADVDSNPDALEWDVGDWATNAPATVPAGVDAGTIGKRFKLTITGDAAGEHRPTGIEMVAVLLPDREYNA